LLLLPADAKSLVLRGTHDLTAWSLRDLTAHPNLRALTLPYAFCRCLHLTAG